MVDSILGLTGPGIRSLTAGIDLPLPTRIFILFGPTSMTPTFISSRGGVARAFFNPQNVNTSSSIRPMLNAQHPLLLAPDSIINLAPLPHRPGAPFAISKKKDESTHLNMQIATSNQRPGHHCYWSLLKRPSRSSYAGTVSCCSPPPK